MVFIPSTPSQSTRTKGRLNPPPLLRHPQKYEPVIDKLPPKPRFIMRRTLENVKFGAGKDYRL